MQIEKALERCNELTKETHSCWIGITNQVAIKALIDYIETMQSEFDRLEGIEDNTAMLKKELEESKKETQGIYDDYQDLGKEYYKLQCELVKAEKVIDEMANSLIGIGMYDIKKGLKVCFNEEEVKEYYYKKVSDNK